jgi:hypothetical protein
MPRGTDCLWAFVDAGRTGRRVFLGDSAVRNNFAAGRGQDERLLTDKIRPIQCMGTRYFALSLGNAGVLWCQWLLDI